MTTVESWNTLANGFAQLAKNAEISGSKYYLDDFCYKRMNALVERAAKDFFDLLNTEPPIEISDDLMILKSYPEAIWPAQVSMTFEGDYWMVVLGWLNSFGGSGVVFPQPTLLEPPVSWEIDSYYDKEHCAYHILKGVGPYEYLQYRSPKLIADFFRSSEGACRFVAANLTFLRDNKQGTEATLTLIQRQALLVLYRNGAFERIAAVKAENIGREMDTPRFANNIKKDLSALRKDFHLVESCTKNPGGHWLTPTGKELAKNLAHHPNKCAPVRH